MKTLLYTGSDIAYDELAEITVPRMRSYALKHNMDFVHWIKPLIDVPNGIYWTGVCGALKAFEKGYERAIYLDVDQLITNFDVVPIPKSTNGFHASRDWGSDAVHPWSFSMCGFLAFDSVAPIFAKALELEPEFRDKPFPEQAPMQLVISGLMEDQPGVLKKCPLPKEILDAYPGIATVHPRKVFNCVPDEVCCGNVPEPWEPGDWCAHLTMLPLEDRVKLAKEILSKL